MNVPLPLGLEVKNYTAGAVVELSGLPAGTVLSAGNAIGTGQAAGRNIISGFNYGVVLRGTTQSVVAGNYIGTDLTGTHPLGNWAGIGRHFRRLWGHGDIATCSR